MKLSVKSVLNTMTHRGFTLLEVLIAMGIFFMAIFAILDLVAQNLRIARGLRLGEVEFGSVAAELSMTNRLTEGTTTGDFGDLRPGASWAAETRLYSSNGLFQVDIVIDWPENGLVQQRKGSILLYRPDSPNPSFAR
ncbi:MAG: prepilin-type N-terminal cleavage/methylation domain-containing protein [Verrucomicrobiae bacterium]|nr:prepilin-type N-terminal cleavage/methylation domain-containing protein [Verrucomicrobiae bacterium]